MMHGLLCITVEPLFYLCFPILVFAVATVEMNRIEQMFASGSEGSEPSVGDSVGDSVYQPSSASSVGSGTDFETAAAVDFAGRHSDFDSLASDVDSEHSSVDSMQHPLYIPPSDSETTEFDPDDDDEDRPHYRFGGPVFAGDPVVQPVAQVVQLAAGQGRGRGKDVDYMCVQIVVHSIPRLGPRHQLQTSAAVTDTTKVEEEHHGQHTCRIFTSPFRLLIPEEKRGSWMRCLKQTLKSHHLTAAGPGAASSVPYSLDAISARDILLSIGLREVLLEIYNCKWGFELAMQFLLELQQDRIDVLARFNHVYSGIVEQPRVVLDVSGPVIREFESDFDTLELIAIRDVTKACVTAPTTPVPTPSKGTVGNVSFQNFPGFAALGKYYYGGCKINFVVCFTAVIHCGGSCL
jgi:hypothetical protein